MGLLDRIFSFFRGIFRPPERDLEDEEREEREGISKDIIFRRKILKSKFYRSSARKAIQVFAVTFEDNNTDRFEELLEEVRKYSEANFLFFGKEEYGYDDQQRTPNPPFIFPVIEVGEE